MDVFSVSSDPRLYEKRTTTESSATGVEARDPASSRRRRKGKSGIWDSKIWSRVPRDSDPRKTVVARTSSIYKRGACPLVREGAPPKEGHNCQTAIHIWPWASDRARQRFTDWLIVSRNVSYTLTLTLRVQLEVWSEVESVQWKTVICEML
jgi:hypothetical protein